MADEFEADAAGLRAGATTSAALAGALTNGDVTPGHSGGQRSHAGADAVDNGGGLDARRSIASHKPTIGLPGCRGRPLRKH